jgi:hypothetical protein
MRQAILLSRRPIRSRRRDRSDAGRLSSQGVRVIVCVCVYSTCLSRSGGISACSLSFDTPVEPVSPPFVK